MKPMKQNLLKWTSTTSELAAPRGRRGSSPTGAARWSTISAAAVLWICSAAACSGAKGAAAPPSPSASVKGAGSQLIQLSPEMRGFFVTNNPPASEPLSQIESGDSLFFKSVETARFLQIRVDGDFADSKDCETQTGFRCFKTGAESRAIEPGGIVTLCFHRPGKYKLTVLGAEKPLQGFVEVGAR